MKVKMLKNTVWDQMPVRVDSELDVSDKVGQRWINRKIAVAAESGTAEPPEQLEPKGPTLSELRKAAKKFGIDGYNKMSKLKLLEVIKEISDLRYKAFTEDLNIENYESMNVVELRAAIEAKRAEIKKTDEEAAKAQAHNDLLETAYDLEIESAETMTDEELTAAIFAAESKE
jgi:hypothetical protein